MLKKIFQKKENRIFLISILIVFSIAIIDIFAMNSGLFGTPEQYTGGCFAFQWWILFRNIAYLLMVLSSVIYFILFKDLSESISIGASSFVIWVFGIGDIAYFLFQGKALPDILPWLDNSLVISKVSSILSYAPVTNISLFVSAGIGLLISYLLIKVLVKRF